MTQTASQTHQHRMVRRRPDDISFARLSEIARSPKACLTLFERLRFPDGLACPWCGACEPTSRFVRHRSRPGLYSCGTCRKQFSLTSGTAMHRTKLPLGQWLRAIWLIVSSSKGISARKLGEMLGLTYKVAWHLGHRIRSMMTEGDLVLGRLGAVVEMDEVYAGAPPRPQNRPEGSPPPVPSAPVGRGTKRPLVLTMVERGGLAVMKRISSHSTAAIEGAARPHLASGATLATDALPAYQRVATSAEHRHLRVNHSAGEFVAHDPEGLQPPAHTNTAESLHNDVRRAVLGVWHWISAKHLDRYLGEIAWRRNRKAEAHLSRIAAVLSSGVGPLPFDHLTGRAWGEPPAGPI